MATPTLTPASTTSASKLPATGTVSSVSAELAFGIYASNANFLSGAADQVAYTYKKLGGDVLDIELKEGNVYAAYEEAVLEYSYLLNVHQSKNVLSDLLGSTTGSFDQDGQLQSGDSLENKAIESSYPQFQFSYARKVGHAISNEVNLNGFQNVYSASFNTTSSVQDYDLQSIISSQAGSDDALDFYNKVGNNRILIRKVFYKTPQSMWRFYGYYGGLNTVGNMQNYGQWADDSQFQIVPVWQNKQQALMFEDAIYTRNSHYSYELKNNKLRIFPNATSVGPSKMWVEFVIPNEKDPWEEDSNRVNDVGGVNNMNNLPFANIGYDTINSIGKQWIRRFALSVAKEILGQIRSKFATVPIPGDAVTLNGSALISEAKEEQVKLREELKTVLDEMTYNKLVENDTNTLDNVLKMQEKLPLPIFQG